MADQINRIVLIVLDSVGCGDAPDADKYGDEDSNTLSNISQKKTGKKRIFFGHPGSLG